MYLVPEYMVSLAKMKFLKQRFWMNTMFVRMDTFEMHLNQLVNI